MTPAPTKRSAGRPRKNAKKQENPDCEVASKGYVKCLMRKMTDIKHTHGTTDGDTTEAIGIATMVLSFVSVIGWLVASKAEYSNLVTMFSTIFWMSLVLFAACACNSPVSINKEMMSDHIPDYLKKHEEPPCGPKRGCEE
jgi:hypothetical protein